jgi:hypothetical protein
VDILWWFLEKFLQNETIPSLNDLKQNLKMEKQNFFKNAILFFHCSWFGLSTERENILIAELYPTSYLNCQWCSFFVHNFVMCGILLEGFNEERLQDKSTVQCHQKQPESKLAITM